MKYNLNEAYKGDYYSSQVDWKLQAYGVIAKEIHRKFCPDSLIDIGCGNGILLKTYPEDILLKGVDGSETAIKQRLIDNVELADLREPVELGQYNIVVSIEVAEHIEPEHTDMFVTNLVTSVMPTGVIIITAAPPGQSGTMHVNCQPREYWVKKFKQYGFEEYDISEMRLNIKNQIPFLRHYLVNNMMAFRRVV